MKRFVPLFAAVLLISVPAAAQQDAAQVGARLLEFGFLRNRLLPVMTFASWTRPLTDAEMSAVGIQADWGLTPADHAGTTVRMTQDRRLIIRNTYKTLTSRGTKGCYIHAHGIVDN